MDHLGDADELGDDDIGDEQRAGLLTPETYAISGAGLLLFSLVSGGPLQLLQYDVYRSVDGGDPGLLWLVGPGAAFALLGALFGVRARRVPMAPAMAGLGGAAVVVGSILVAVYVFGYLRLVT